MKASCVANGLKVNNVITDAIAEPDAIIEAAVIRRDKAERAKKAAQILQLKNELGLSDSDLKKLLKYSEQTDVKADVTADTKSVEEGIVSESRHAHKGIYEYEEVNWEVDRYTDGYFCRTSDGSIHKKDVDGTIVS